MKITVSVWALALSVCASGILFTSCESVPASSHTSNKRTSSVGGGTRVNHFVLKQSNRKNTRVVIDIADQKSYLLVNGKVAMTSPVSTARPGKYTPRGSFSISERVQNGKISTIYGVHMPYWMRLSGTAYGVHAGHLPGYPASAGCVRLPSKAAQVIYDNTSYGTRVNIYSSWNGS